jgi:type II secretory pathway pseudopilin PulG
MIKNNCKNLRRIKSFTLIELMIVMAIFIVLFAILARFYKAAYRVTSSVNEHTMTFENAKIAMDLMTREIQCIYYENENTPFWHWQPSDSTNPPSGWGDYRNELLAFVSVTNFPQNDDSTSKISEIKYQKYYATNHDLPNDGWLRRSVTSNKLSDGTDNPKWNYYNNLVVGYKTDDIDGTDTPIASFTADSSSSGSYQKVIPYVTDLTFTCFDKVGNEITPDNGTSTTAITDMDADNTTGFPFSIEISLSLMNKNSWQKWIDIGGNVIPQNDTGDVEAFRKKHERTFKKTVLIGNRGQYE